MKSPLKSPRIVTGPKRVLRVTLLDGGFPVRDGIDLAQFAPAVADLVLMIENGLQIPEKHYRKSGGRDLLLETEGWLHLHVAPELDDDVLLIVEQHTDRVILIGLCRHTIFNERPRGSSFKGLKRRIESARIARLKPKA